jgi:secreted trypsin-like serine protease
MRWLIKGDRQEDSGIQWPTISLLFNVEAASSCTVSILSPEWLATSHSCLASASLDPLSWVLFGGPAGGDLAVNGTQIKTVQDIVSHPQTRRSQHLFSNDLALVRLQEPLEFNDEVSSICVASKAPEADQLCVTAGWTAGGAGVTYSQYLNYLPQPVVPDVACNSSSMYSGKLTPDTFCSRADGDSNLCQEDKGTPLMCLSGEVWQLQGVLSSRGGCSNSRPAIFSSLPDQRDWILQTLGSA